MTQLSIDCPRCGAQADEQFYGPCAVCRAELRTTIGSHHRRVVEVEYEPKMNVTPNAVALKDD